MLAFMKCKQQVLPFKDFQPLVETKWLVTGALVLSLGLPHGRGRSAATNLRFQVTLGKNTVKWTSVRDSIVHPPNPPHPFWTSKCC